MGFSGLSQVDSQLSAAHAVADSDNWTGHFLALDVDEMEQISGVIEPASC
jgi:hypothetical protein